MPMPWYRRRLVQLVLILLVGLLGACVILLGYASWGKHPQPVARTSNGVTASPKPTMSVPQPGLQSSTAAPTDTAYLVNAAASAIDRLSEASYQSPDMQRQVVNELVAPSTRNAMMSQYESTQLTDAKQALLQQLPSGSLTQPADARYFSDTVQTLKYKIVSLTGPQAEVDLFINEVLTYTASNPDYYMRAYAIRSMRLQYSSGRWLFAGYNQNPPQPTTAMTGGAAVYAGDFDPYLTGYKDLS